MAMAISYTLLIQWDYTKFHFYGVLTGMQRATVELDDGKILRESIFLNTVNRWLQKMPWAPNPWIIHPIWDFLAYFPISMAFISLT